MTVEFPHRPDSIMTNIGDLLTHRTTINANANRHLITITSTPICLSSSHPPRPHRYQGENNMHGDPGSSLQGGGYGCMAWRMVDSWREAWSVVPGSTSPSAPFGVVTIAPGGSEGAGYHLSVFRWAQTANYGRMPNPLMPNTCVRGDTCSVCVCVRGHVCLYARLHVCVRSVCVHACIRVYASHEQLFENVSVTPRHLTLQFRRPSLRPTRPVVGPRLPQLRPVHHQHLHKRVLWTCLLRPTRSGQRVLQLRARVGGQHAVSVGARFGGLERQLEDAGTSCA